MIDPHEKYFLYKGDKTTGYSWHLKHKQAQIASISDQFQPFQGVFNASKQTFEQGYYPGTIFRFPLRSQPSEISDTVYKPERVRELFRNFEEDAHLVLIFLKNLESIELLTRESNGTEPKLQFKVEVSASCLEYVRQQRKSFQERIVPGKWMDEPITITYPLVITTTSYSTGTKVKKSYKYLVNEYYSGGSHASLHLQALQKDPALSYVPMAGTAMALGVATEEEGEGAAQEKKEIADEDNATDQNEDENKTAESETPSGHVFCFLPLPLEQKSATGLPVHVNGYFSVSQNRRHLKWPTAGQNVKTDKALLWNQCLLQEVLPNSYFQLILQVRDILHYITLHNTALCYNTLRYATLRYTTIHYTTLRYTAFTIH